MTFTSYILFILGIIIPIIFGQQATNGGTPGIGFKNAQNGSIEIMGQKVNAGYDVGAGVGGRKRRDTININYHQSREKRETDAEIMEEKQNSIIQRASEIINNIYERIGQELKQIREYFREKQQNFMKDDE